MNLSRTFLQATDEAQIWDFYVMKLGFRVIKQLIPENEPGTSFLLELGSSQVEIKCSNKPRIYLDNICLYLSTRYIGSKSVWRIMALQSVLMSRIHIQI